MASGLAQTLANGVLNNLCRGTTYTFPTSLFIGLFTATPSDSGGGTEVSGGSYARIAIVSGTGTWTASTTGSNATSGAVTFTTATASWGTVTQFGIFDAITAGNLLYWGDVGTSKAVGSGDTAQFASGQITLALT